AASRMPKSCSRIAAMYIDSAESSSNLPFIAATVARKRSLSLEARPWLKAPTCTLGPTKSYHGGTRISMGRCAGSAPDGTARNQATNRAAHPRADFIVRRTLSHPLHDIRGQAAERLLGSRDDRLDERIALDLLQDLVDIDVVAFLFL